MNRFINELNLRKSWSKFEIDFTHTFELKEPVRTYISTLDHFFWNESLETCISDCGVLHIAENSSDHCPIYCVIDTELLIKKTSETNSTKQKPCWKKASQDNKRDYVDNL